MEYCNGGDVAQCIRAARDAASPLDIDTILDWFAQLVLAVAYVHRRRVLHRALERPRAVGSRRRKAGHRRASRAPSPALLPPPEHLHPRT